MLKAPVPTLIQDWQLQDGSNTLIQRIPGALTPIPVKELPYIPVYAPSQFTGRPPHYYQHGWSQAFVPEAIQRQPLQAETPFLQLSQPLRYDLQAAKQTQAALRRQPLKAKAPAHH